MWRFAILVVNDVPGHRDRLCLDPACATCLIHKTSETEGLLGAVLLKLGRIKTISSARGGAWIARSYLVGALSGCVL